MGIPTSYFSMPDINFLYQTFKKNLMNPYVPIFAVIVIAFTFWFNWRHKKKTKLSEVPESCFIQTSKHYDMLWLRFYSDILSLSSRPQWHEEGPRATLTKWWKSNVDIDVPMSLNQLTGIIVKNAKLSSTIAIDIADNSILILCIDEEKLHRRIAIYNGTELTEYFQWVKSEVLHWKKTFRINGIPHDMRIDENGFPEQLTLEQYREKKWG